METFAPPSGEARERLAIWRALATTATAVVRMGKSPTLPTVIEMRATCDAYSDAARAYLDLPLARTPDSRRNEATTEPVV